MIPVVAQPEIIMEGRRACARAPMMGEEEGKVRKHQERGESSLINALFSHGLPQAFNMEATTLSRCSVIDFVIVIDDSDAVHAVHADGNGSPPIVLVLEPILLYTL